MPNLNTRTTQFNIVISLKQAPNDIDVRLSRLVNDKLICNYVYILHDKDYTSTGEKKTPHYHIIIWNNSERLRFSTMINLLSENLNISPLAISIDKIVSLEGSIQYLIHKNDIDKYQYDIVDIETNLQSDELELYLLAQNSVLTFDRLYNLILKSETRLQIIEALGLNYYRAYRPVINDIITSLTYNGHIIK